MVAQALGKLEGLRLAIEEAGIAVDEVITSGTPSFHAALELDLLTQTTHRVSPGTVVFFDGRSADCSELAQHFAPAALVLTRIISHPKAHRVTADAASKSLAAEVGVPCVTIHNHPTWRAQRPSEEHLLIDLPEGEASPELGSPLMLIPKHVCLTLNLAESAPLRD